MDEYLTLRRTSSGSEWEVSVGNRTLLLTERAFSALIAGDDLPIVPLMTAVDGHRGPSAWDVTR